MSQALPLPNDISDPISLADWLEISALLSDDSNASHGDLERVLNRLGSDDGQNVEEQCSSCMNEIRHRIDSIGDKYPFSFSGSLISLKADWKEYTPYIFCLLLSYGDEKQKKIPRMKHEQMFEDLSCIAAKNYLGGTDVLRFGSPRTDMPSGFKDALERLCRDVNEWNSSLVGNTLHQKDGGLDLIAWKSFKDRQIGKLVLFGHCASGANWEEKISELIPDNFCSEWLSGTKSPIVKTFFIPHRVPTDRWEHVAIRAKLLFDRCRIAYWTGNTEFATRTGGKGSSWCESVLKKISK